MSAQLFLGVEPRRRCQRRLAIFVVVRGAGLLRIGVRRINVDALVPKTRRNTQHVLAIVLNHSESHFFLNISPARLLLVSLLSSSSESSVSPRIRLGDVLSPPSLPPFLPAFLSLGCATEYVSADRWKKLSVFPRVVGVFRVSADFFLNWTLLNFGLAGFLTASGVSGVDDDIADTERTLASVISRDAV